MKLTREVKTAILVITGIIFFIFGFSFLKGKNLLNNDSTYYTYYDNVEGIGKSTPVTINGLNVGKVLDISFADDGSGKLKVSLLVDTDFQFSKNSKAELYENGLIGGKAIAIVPAFDDAEIAENGDSLEGAVKPGLSDLVNQQLTPLQEKIESAMVSADSLLMNINDVFDDTTKNNIKAGIAGLEVTMSSFQATSYSLNKFIKSTDAQLQGTLGNLNSASGKFDAIADSLANANLTQTVNNLEQTLGNINSLLASVDQGEGTLGKLFKEEGLYDNLEGASKQLEELLQDFKLNPKRYVHFSMFGKKPKDYDAEANQQKDNN